MPTPRLIRIMQRFFNMLFYCELLLFFVFLPVFVSSIHFFPDLLITGSSSGNRTVIGAKSEASKSSLAPASDGQVDSASHSQVVKPITLPRREGYEESSVPSRFNFYLEAKGVLFPNWKTSSGFYQQWQAKLKIPPSISLTTTPDIRIARTVETTPSFSLQFGFNSWQELLALPWIASLLFLSILFVWLGCTLTITYLFKLLFDSLHLQDYFGKKQIGRLNTIGWLFIGHGLFQYSTYIVKGWFVKSILAQHGIEMNFQLVAGWVAGADALLTGIVILVLARIFAYGQLLKQEQELTI